MHIYLVNYWGRYSEYGGLVIVCANSETEAIALLIEEYSKCDHMNLDPKAISLEVHNAVRFRLATNENYPPGIIEAHIT